LSITVLVGAACQGSVSTTQEQTATVDGTKLMDGFPFKIDSMAAYNGQSFISVYFAGPSDVVAVTFDISETCESDMPVELSKKSTVTHSSGDNIGFYVLPRGPVPPFPPDYEYTQKQAVSGLISCKILPSEELNNELYKLFSFSLTDISFEDGTGFAIEPMKIIAGVFPP